MNRPKNNRSQFTILLVDDNPTNIDVLRRTLEREGYKIAVAPNGEVALKTAPKCLPDLILLDVMMPGIDGYETCRRLKEDPAVRDIPILFITAKNDPEEIVQGFNAGGLDYIGKPFRSMELCSRVWTHVQMRAFGKEREKLIEDLKSAIEKLDQLAKIDPLTGLSNRRALLQDLEREKSRYNRTQKPFSIIIGDIDHFKNVNDGHGHDAGDYVLSKIAEILKLNSRKYDTVGRWGGEEFLILSPESDLHGGIAFAEKLRKVIESEIFSCSQAKLRITMSFGVSTYQKEYSTKEFIKSADLCLYKAKEEGRNRVNPAPPQGMNSKETPNPHQNFTISRS